MSNALSWRALAVVVADRGTHGADPARPCRAPEEVPRMILFSAGLAAAAAAAARRRRQRLGERAPLPEPDLSRLLWGEAVAATRALSARIRRRMTR